MVKRGLRVLLFATVIRNVKISMCRDPFSLTLQITLSLKLILDKFFCYRFISRYSPELLTLTLLTLRVLRSDLEFNRLRKVKLPQNTFSGLKSNEELRIGFLQ